MISTSEACEENEHYACEYETESDSYLCACPCHTDYDGNAEARWTDNGHYFEPYLVGQGELFYAAAELNARVSDSLLTQYANTVERMQM